MRRAFRLAAAVGVAALPALSGCGQKGPLYLPEKGAAVVRPAPPAPAATPQNAAPAPEETAPAAPATPKKPDEDSDSQSPQSKQP